MLQKFLPLLSSCSLLRRAETKLRTRLIKTRFKIDVSFTHERVQPWWLGGKAPTLHSVESWSLLPQWIKSHLMRFYKLILTKKELMPWTVICTCIS